MGICDVRMGGRCAAQLKTGTMISVTLDYLVLIFLLLMLAPIVFAWVLDGWRWRRRQRDAFRHVLRCSMCAWEYEDATENPLPRCPACGSLNERTHAVRG